VKIAAHPEEALQKVQTGFADGCDELQQKPFSMILRLFISDDRHDEERTYQSSLCRTLKTHAAWAWHWRTRLLQLLAVVAF
jgi:hypothetical protein